MSEKTIRILNNGQRTIQYAPEGFHKPKQTIDYPEEIGLRHLRLYPGELLDLAAATAPFAGAKPAAAASTAAEGVEDVGVLDEKVESDEETAQPARRSSTRRG